MRVAVQFVAVAVIWISPWLGTGVSPGVQRTSKCIVFIRRIGCWDDVLSKIRRTSTECLGNTRR